MLLVVGYGMMSTQSARYRAANKTVQAAQALQLALSGLEDIRVKLERDDKFPGSAAEDQKVFNYVEDVSDLGKAVGSYEVQMDTSNDRPPWYVIKVTCTGVVGPKEKPVATRRIRAELRHISSETTADVRWSWVRFEDLGSL